MQATALLDRVASEAGKLDLVCDLTHKGKMSQVVLRARGQQKTVQAGMCINTDGYWNVEWHTAKTLVGGLKVLAKKYKGAIQADTLRLDAKKSPLRGEELSAVTAAALLEAFGGKVTPELSKKVESAAGRLADGSAKVIVRKTAPKIPPPRIDAPDSLHRRVAGENAWLTRQRAAVAEKWPPLKSDSAWSTHTLVLALLAVGRQEEAVELARELVTLLEPKAKNNGDLRAASSWALAVLAWTGDAEAQQDTARLKDWLAINREYTELDLLCLQPAVLNACHNPKVTLPRAMQMAASAVGNAIAMHALAKVPPWSTWYEAKPLAKRIERALATMGARLKSKPSLPLPAGWDWRDPYLADPRYTLAFDVPASAAKVEEHACQSCGKAVRAAQCAACETWFVAPKGEPVLCAPHQGVRDITTVVDIQRAATKERTCPKCRKRFSPVV